ncbi:RICIN domain-containing protein [Lipingzhangella sp. LS1_29]|uniref:RICIN domain-containing protein n=1 Tax=Lipingzhangella rawalii TaxID=2055835 RepID=A0ABU2HCE4_9ACTN|nr:RICIN domain-containing protein [Lipingzhangella rawalii]MDS1272505.1 RICIN domain-containing protein [Lipingzhangella rawalii]
MKRIVAYASATTLALAAGMALLAPLPAAAHSPAIAQGIDYQIQFEPNDARMVPYGGAATRTDVRVWPVDYRGMDWELTQTGFQGNLPTYEIRNLHSNLCLEPKDGLTRADQRVEQRQCTGRDRQEWLLPYMGDNGHHIVPVRNTHLGTTLENPAWTGSFLKLDYRSSADPDFRWNFQPL